MIKDSPGSISSDRRRLAKLSFESLVASDNEFALDNFADLVTDTTTLKYLEDCLFGLSARGALVPQDPSEGRGSDLFDELSLSNRKPKVLNMGPFNIPSSWSWVQLGSIVDLKMGKTPKRAESKWWGDDGLPFVSIADLVDQSVVSTTKEMVSQRALDEVFRGRVVEPGTLLYSFKLTIGKMSILDMKAVHNEAIMAIDTPSKTLRNYLFRVLKSIDPTSLMRSAIKGKTLNSKTLPLLEVPLPPLPEQIRIVEKLDEIMIKVNELKTLLA